MDKNPHSVKVITEKSTEQACWYNQHSYLYNTTARGTLPVLNYPVIFTIQSAIAHYQHTMVQLRLGAENWMVHTRAVEL